MLNFVSGCEFSSACLRENYTSSALYRECHTHLCIFLSFGKREPVLNLPRLSRRIYVWLFGLQARLNIGIVQRLTNKPFNRSPSPSEHSTNWLSARPRCQLERVFQAVSSTYFEPPHLGPHQCSTMEPFWVAGSLAILELASERGALRFGSTRRG